MREDYDQAPGRWLAANRPPASRDRRPIEGYQHRWRPASFHEESPHVSRSTPDHTASWPPAESLSASGRPRRPLQHGWSPRIVSYLVEDSQAYVLHDLVEGYETQVPKRRAAPEIFPPTREQQAPGAGLVRLSGFALFGVLLGGAPGSLLGALVALIAMVRLVGFERRVQIWRSHAAERGSVQRLPAEATSERLRLITALWQSVGAAVLGSTVLALLLVVLR
jgi:hypothetical protein